MVLSKKDILNELKNLKIDLKLKYKVKNIGIFGSYVRNTHSASSDIDFLVEFEDEADLIHLIGLSRYLGNIFNSRVDVISKSSIKEELKPKILKEVIYA